MTASRDWLQLLDWLDARATQAQDQQNQATQATQAARAARAASSASQASQDPPPILLADLVSEAEKWRKHYFANRIQLHIINNVRNGNCNEDCGYCAQRKRSHKHTAQVPVPPQSTGYASQSTGWDAARVQETADQATIVAYKRKGIEEILAEAELAVQAGAYRYCLVSAGRGPTPRDVDFYCQVISEIKKRYAIQVCLSAGLLTDATLSKKLKGAGLDRYNHNLNSSERNYEHFCQTHTYDDRLETLRNLTRAGISLCSGVIIGLGETNAEIIEMAQKCAQLQIPSIPVNFFLPVPDHAISHSRFEQNRLEKNRLEQNRKAGSPAGTTVVSQRKSKTLAKLATAASQSKSKTMQEHADFCLAVLAIFRLCNPQAEIRLAAGREYYLQGESQLTAFRIVNSVFVEGYLNVRGQGAQNTIDMIKKAGYQIETGAQQAQEQELQQEASEASSDVGANGIGIGIGNGMLAAVPGKLALKDGRQLRPTLRTGYTQDSSL